MAIGKSDRFLMNGYNLAEYMQSVETEGKKDVLDASVLASTDKQWQQGFRGGNLDAAGIFDADETNEDAIHNVLSTAFTDGASNVLTVGVGFFAVGTPCIMMDACQGSYKMPINIGDLITVSADFESSNSYNFGHFLMSSAQAAGTNNGSSVDNAASTANGGLLHVHLHNDDASDVDVKVQHSTDGSSWADLTGAAVPNLSATHASGSATVAAGTTVNRYLRAVATVTGGDTLLVSVAFARR